MAEDQTDRQDNGGVATARDSLSVTDNRTGDTYEVEIKPLIEKALGVQTFREDREHESEFVTILYWEDIPAMSRFTGGDPARIHHLDRDAEFLIELPKSVQILRLLKSHGRTG